MSNEMIIYSTGGRKEKNQSEIGKSYNMYKHTFSIRNLRL